MEQLLLFSIAALVMTIIIGTILILSRLRQLNEDSSAALLKQDIDGLSRSITDMKDGLTTRLTDSLDKNQQMMLSNMRQQFSESSKLVSDVTKNLVELKETNKQVVSVTDELKTLQNILQNPKQRGVLGEYYLQTVLENVLPPDRFTMQYAFKDGEIVDAVIYLDKNKVLPIDSKFSLENYNRLVEEKDPARRAVYIKAFKADLKQRIDETAKYIRPSENTMDFAFMFIPSEAIYYDLLINQVGSTATNARDLIEYAFRDKQVIIVSPTSFMAYLQTVMQGLRSLQIEEQAQEIQKRVGLLGRHVQSYEDLMGRMGKSLSTTVNHYNNAHRELGKIDKDVSKIAGTKSLVQPEVLDRPQSDE